MSIKDMMGRTVFVERGQYIQGNNAVILKAAALKTPGIFTYTLQADGFSATRKLILVK